MNAPDREGFLSSGLIRAARGLLNINQQDLADMAGLSLRTVAAIETDILVDGDYTGAEGRSVDARRRVVLSRIRAILESEGMIQFTFSDGAAGEGVRLKRPMTLEFYESVKKVSEAGRRAREARLAEKHPKPTKSGRSSKMVSPISGQKK